MSASPRKQSECRTLPGAPRVAPGGAGAGQFAVGAEASAPYLIRDSQPKPGAWFNFAGWTDEDFAAFAPKLRVMAQGLPGVFVPGAFTAGVDVPAFVQSAGFPARVVEAMRGGAV